METIIVKEGGSIKGLTFIWGFYGIGDLHWLILSKLSCDLYQQC